MQAMFYAVPIIYPITMVTATSTIVAQIMLVNPIAQVIQDVRNNLITAEAVTTWELVGPLGGIASIGIVVVVMIVAVLYFRKKAKYFAEEV